MNLSLTIQIRIKATIPQVWEALTSPEWVKQYFFGSTLVTTWEIGSPIYFRGDWEGTPYEDKGIVLEFVPLQHLQYNYFSAWSTMEDMPEHYANIRYAIEEESGGCIVTVTQDKIEDEEKKAQSEQNWLSILGAMKELLEKQ